MQMVRAFSALLLIIGSDAMETGEALRNRGADSFAEVGVGRKDGGKGVTLGEVGVG